MMPSTTRSPMASVPGAGASLLDKLDRLVGTTALHEARVYPVTVPSGGVSQPATVGMGEVSGVGTLTSLTTPPTALTTIVQTNDFVVLPGPEDVLLLNTTTGLYQQSVTLTARMYPIEATAAKSIWGLPTLIWGILIGTVVILILILATLFFCCWLQPRTRKLLNSSYYTTAANNGNASQSSIVAKSCTSSDSNQLVMPLSIGICPPQYSAPPPPNATQQPSHQSPSSSSHAAQPTGPVASGSNSSIHHHAAHAAAAGAHHTCSGTQQQCGSMASGGGQDYAHVKYGSSPQQQQYAQQYAQHHHHGPQQQQQQQHHQHQCIHYQQQYNQQLHHQQQQQQQQQQHVQQHHGHHVHGQQYSPYNQHQYYHHPSPQQQQQQQEHHHQHHQQQQQQQQVHQHHQPSSSHHHQGAQLVHTQLHKSMWAINPLYASSGVINDESEGETGTSYRTRSLPSWGKNKQRPLSNADDLEELYAKVNFSKKRRNRMRNDEAAIIALCRSRSQNLSALPLATTEQDAVVVYDERTAL
ncbi:homeobox protein 13-like isoform X3 [Anopheles coustani]|uniref:homeobox protein 13-like isoform X3 n=1 Tax=Anopheles coustani TaxID=139045 RepID=UPI0026597C48|nr:homeobox protein 13-like isoform X3 [Anopheles coustani]